MFYGCSCRLRCCSRVNLGLHLLRQPLAGAAPPAPCWVTIFMSSAAGTASMPYGAWKSFTYLRARGPKRQTSLSRGKTLARLRSRTESSFLVCDWDWPELHCDQILQAAGMSDSRWTQLRCFTSLLRAGALRHSAYTLHVSVPPLRDTTIPASLLLVAITSGMCCWHRWKLWMLRLACLGKLHRCPLLAR